MDEKDSLQLDALDWRLLRHLEHDASETNQALAQRMGISPATCLRRVRALEQCGLITRRVAVLSPALSPSGLQALAEVSLDRQGAEFLDAFEARARADTGVATCWRVTPGPDFVLLLQLDDMQAYQALVERLFTQNANVRNVKTYFVTNGVAQPPGAAQLKPGPSPAPGAPR